VVVGAGNYFNRSDRSRVFAWDAATAPTAGGRCSPAESPSRRRRSVISTATTADVVIGSTTVLQAYRGNGAALGDSPAFLSGPGHASPLHRSSPT